VSAHGVAGPGGEEGRSERRERRSPDGLRPSRPQLRVVAAVDAAVTRPGLRKRVAVVGAGVFVAAVVFGLVGVRVVLAQNQFRLDRINARAAAEESAYERLRLQVDQLESPERIVAAAEGRLGMVQPLSVTYLTPSAPATGPGASASGAGATSAQRGRPTPTSEIPAPAGGPAEWAAVKPQLGTGP
jgi:cell division protein FtsL